MDVNSISSIKNEYLKILGSDSKYNNIVEQLNKKSIEAPILNIYDLNPEDDISYSNEQRQLTEMLLDMHAVNNGMIEIKNKVQNIISEFDESLNLINTSINKQLEEANDINMLCGNESEYNMIVPVYATDFGSTSAEIIDAKTLGASIYSSSTVKYEVISVSGNGYSGNAFVYNDQTFENTVNDKSNIKYIMDSSDITTYEYSRLCTTNADEELNNVVNNDDKEVICTITLKGNNNFCKAKILSPNNNLIVTKIETSDDGVNYVTRSNKDIPINSLDTVYSDSSYIYGSHIICFPYSYFVRLTFKDNTVTEDTIAVKTNEDVIKLLPNTKRKKIEISEIQLFTSVYTEANLASVEFLQSGNVEKVSLFATEYIPDHFPDNDYIKYSIVVNGTSYEIVPVNSGREGVNLIKVKQDNATVLSSTQLIGETIKSIKLNITIKDYNGLETPYVSNMKLCLGKDTNKIYV